MIQRRLPLLWALVLAIGAAGCAKPMAPEVSAPKVEAGGQREAPNAPTSPAAQPQDEVSRWSAMVAKEPTADNWNELSFAYIQAGQWSDAVRAGQEALKLKGDHPYALYNVGLALVKSDKPLEALYYLKQTAALQPDRHEPLLLLAQAYQQVGSHLLADHYARKAVSLAKGDPAAAETQSSIAAMLAAKPPADLATACAIQLSDGGFSLCIYKETAPERTVSSGASAYPGNRYTLWYGPASGPLKPIPVGYTQADKLVKTALPGGGTGYWLGGGFVGAGVAGTQEWRLFVRDGNGLRQVLFLGGDSYEGGAVSDFMRSAYAPPVSGEQIVTSHRDDVTGSRTMRTTRRLSLAERTATVTMEEVLVEGPLTQLSPKVEVQSGWNYKWAYGLAENAKVTLNGQPAKLADLKVGWYARLTARDGVITELVVSSLP